MTAARTTAAVRTRVAPAMAAAAMAAAMATTPAPHLKQRSMLLQPTKCKFKPQRRMPRPAPSPLLLRPLRSLSPLLLRFSKQEFWLAKLVLIKSSFKCTADKALDNALAAAEYNLQRRWHAITYLGLVDVYADYFPFKKKNLIDWDKVEIKVNGILLSGVKQVGGCYFLQTCPTTLCAPTGARCTRAGCLRALPCARRRSAPSRLTGV